MKKMTKLLSMLLAVAMVAGSMIGVSASAINGASLTENFDDITGKADLNGKTVNGLTWAFSDESKGETYQMDTRANSGSVLRVNGNDGKKYADLPLWQVYSGLDYAEGDVELNLSLDVKLDKGAYYDLTLASAELTEADALKKEATAFFSFQRWNPGFRIGRWGAVVNTCTENQWYNIGLKQQKLADGTFKKIWYVDGKPVNVVTDATEYQFDKLVLSGGACEPAPWAYNFSVDNVKFWSSDEYSATYEKYIDTAAELLASAGATALTLTDVEAGYGKPAGETAIQLSGIGNASPAIGIAPTDGENVIIEFDVLLSQPSAKWQIGFDWASNNYDALCYGAGTVNQANWGLNQWNNIKFRAFKDSDGVYKWSSYYNGALIKDSIAKANQSDSSFVVDKFWFWMEQTGTMLIDNLCIKTVNASDAVAYCTQDVHKVSWLDWTGINDGDQYGMSQYTSNWKCSQHANYVTVYDATNNADNVTAPGRGKNSSDNALKMGRKAGAGAVNMRFTFDTNEGMITAFQPGSKVRLGASVLLGDNWLMDDTGVSRINRSLELRVANGEKIAYNNGTLASQVILGPTGLMRYSGGDVKDLTIAITTMSEKKWYRIDYELSVGDGKTIPTTVDLYVDGEKVNDEPMSLEMTEVTDAMLHVYSNHGSSGDSAVESDFYVDDVMFEYIPAGEEAYNPIAVSATSLDDNVVLGNGIVSVLDKAATEYFAFNLTTSIIGPTLSPVNANGDALITEGANGAYLQVLRPGLPAVWYLANDLNVTEKDGTVSVDMLYGGEDMLTAYIAVYNADGSLDKVARDASGDNLVRTSATVADGQTYKVFLWSNGMKPVF